MLLLAVHLGFYDEEILFRIIEAMGRAQFSKAQQRSTLRRLFSRLHSKVRSGQFVSASTLPSIYAEHMQDELGELWTKLMETFGDPLKCTKRQSWQAKENLQAVKAGRLMTGHILPYIPSHLAQAYEVKVDKVNGWLDSLQAVESV